MSRYNFFEEVWNDDIQHTQKGHLDTRIVDILKSADYIIYKIPLSERYRPDLIAQKFYGRGDFYWVLVYTNDITNSPEGFDVNVEIRIPNPSVVSNLR